MSCNCDSNPTNNCENPCGVTSTNTAACESLPSQIQNFSDAFFGTVVKTEISGEVTLDLSGTRERRERGSRVIFFVCSPKVLSD